MVRKMKHCLRSAVLLGLLASSLVHAQATPPDSLLVLAKRGNTVAIVDPTSLKVVTRIPVGKDPHEVIASADGGTAYVSNYGFGAYNTLAVVDLVAQKARPAIDLGPLRGPHGLAFAGGKVWFTAEAAKAIGSYDPKSGQVDWVLGTGQNRTHMIFVAPDQQRIVTTNVNSGTVTVIEKSAKSTTAPAPPGPPGSLQPPPGLPPSGADWEETVVPVGGGPEGFDVSPDGREIWVANSHEGTVSIIDTASKKVTATLAANVVGANRLKFTPDGKQVFISSLRNPELAILDSATRKDVKRLKVGSGAAGILMQPDGARAYVACSPDGYVVVIDLKTLEVVGRIEAGQQPDGLAWASRH